MIDGFITSDSQFKTVKLSYRPFDYMARPLPAKFISECMIACENITLGILTASKLLCVINHRLVQS